MCAREAGQRGRRVAVLEHQDRVGKKIAISGGGRCNFTNIHATAAQYLSQRPEFCKSALARYTPDDFIALVSEHRIAFHEKKLGQLFCDGSSRAIIEMLLAECRKAGVEIHCDCHPTVIERNERFRIGTNHETFEAASLVVATGGLSFAKLGATDFGYRLAEKFGIRLVPPRPGLVPLRLAHDDLTALEHLSGISLPVTVRTRGEVFSEAMLFTHRGLSGPAILQISSFWNEGELLEIDLMPGRSASDWLAQVRSTHRDLATALSHLLPQRFAEAWCKRYAPRKPLPHWKTTELAACARDLAQWRISPAGTEGYPKAEVTVGGIDTTELSSRTMEARRVPGLYFIGEVVDVTGWLGGYNFQWAWASGYAAGQFV